MKIADFGLALEQRGEQSDQLRQRGSFRFWSPEKFDLNAPFDAEKSEVFSIGVILFICAIGRYPFKTATPDDSCYQLLLEGNDNFFKTIEGQNPISDSLKDLLTKMLERDHAQRFTLD